jgi:hypothetical protein
MNWLFDCSTQVELLTALYLGGHAQGILNSADPKNFLLGKLYSSASAYF